MVRERNAAMGGRAEQRIEIAEGADIEGARALVEQSLQPAPQRQIAQWLAALRLITAHRESDPAEAGAAIKIYVQRLAEWPADCVHEAILHRRWRFFPALAELEDACQELAAPRKLLALQLRTDAGAVRRFSEAQRPDPQTTAQRRAAAQRIMREVFGPA
ncbi:hypothetical protein [Alkalilacustris brevis]|uniref:hypothetical protein n=1 Tax=Alkalilacustris brevis TaxID=2026338 RepID=UPI000E0D64F3|nr:hypothetical protein [Alkalilacustris brevis]